MRVTKLSASSAQFRRPNTLMSLKHHLDAFLANFPKERHLTNDPVQFVRFMTIRRTGKLLV